MSVGLRMGLRAAIRTRSWRRSLPSPAGLVVVLIDGRGPRSHLAGVHASAAVALLPHRTDPAPGPRDGCSSFSPSGKPAPPAASVAFGSAPLVLGDPSPLDPCSASRSARRCSSEAVVIVAGGVELARERDATRARAPARVRVRTTAPLIPVRGARQPPALALAGTSVPPGGGSRRPPSSPARSSSSATLGPRLRGRPSPPLPVAPLPRESACSSASRTSRCSRRTTAAA